MQTKNKFANFGATFKTETFCPMSVEIKHTASRKTIWGTIGVTHYLNTSCVPYKVGRENAYPIYFWVTVSRTAIRRRSLIISNDVCTPTQFYGREVVAEIEREQSFIFDVCTQFLADDQAHSVDNNISLMRTPDVSAISDRNYIRASVGCYLDYFSRPLASVIASDPDLIERIMWNIHEYTYKLGLNSGIVAAFERLGQNAFSLGGLNFSGVTLPPLGSDEFRYLAKRYAPDRVPCYELGALLLDAPQVYTIADALLFVRRAPMWRALIKSAGQQIGAIICDYPPTPAKLEKAFADPLYRMLTMCGKLEFAPIK